MDAYLLESWPDDPGEAGLGSALKGIGFLFAPAKYPDGGMLANHGDSIDSIFYIEEGVVEVTYPEQLDSETLSDDEEARSIVLTAPFRMPRDFQSHTIAFLKLT